MQFEKWVRIDVAKGRAETVDLGSFLYTGDSNPLKLGVELYDGDTEYAIEGTVTAKAIIPDGSTVTLTCDSEEEGNRGWAIIPQTALAYPGKIEIFLRVSGSEDGAVVLYAYGTIKRSSTDSVIVPGDPLPDVSEIQTIISDAVELLDGAPVEAVNDRIDALHSLIGYGASNATQTGSRNSIDIETSPGVIKLNKTTTYSNTVSWKLYGTLVGRNGAMGTASTVSSGVYMKAGHTYDVHLMRVSGEQTVGNTYPRIFKCGANTNLLDGHAVLTPYNAADNHYIYRVRFTTDTEISTWITYSARSSFDNAVFALWIEDVTHEVRAFSESIAYGEREYATKSGGYSIGDLLIQNGILYRATAAISTANSEAITPGTNVTRTTVADELKTLQTRIAALEAANN